MILQSATVRICPHLCQMVAIMCLYLWGVKGLGSLKEDEWSGWDREETQSISQLLLFCFSSSSSHFYLFMGKDGHDLDRSTPFSSCSTCLPEITKVLVKTGDLPMSPSSHPWVSLTFTALIFALACLWISLRVCSLLVTAQCPVFTFLFLSEDWGLSFDWKLALNKLIMAYLIGNKYFVKIKQAHTL